MNVEALFRCNENQWWLSEALTIALPLMSFVLVQQAKSVDVVINATLQSSQVVAAASHVKSAISLAKSGRSSLPGQLTIAPWLGSPNGTTEEFLFIQSLEAGGRRAARVTATDSLILDTQATYAESIVRVYTKILGIIVQLAAAERAHTQAKLVERNLADSLRVIETQVAAGSRPGSDVELARAMWSAARIETTMEYERSKALREQIAAYGINNFGSSSSAVSSAIPQRNTLTFSNALGLRGASNAARLSAELRSANASGRPDVSLLVRSQNFTRNFTPNDRGIAVQVSIPVDHGTMRANATTVQSQLTSLEARLKDEQSKQVSLCRSIDATIASLDVGITSTENSVVTPLFNYANKMQRAYLAGTVTVLAYLDAQRSYHDAQRKLITLRDERDQAILQLIEHGGLIPNDLVTAIDQSIRK